MMLQLKRLDPNTLTHAMQLVTECYDREVRAGHRDADYENDWMLEYSKFKRVAYGYPYVGLVGYRGNNPVAISLLTASPVYGDGWGVFSWFYVTPSLKVTNFPKRLARDTVKAGREMGMDHLVAYVAVENDPVKRMMGMIGMKPVEVEYRGCLSDMDGWIREETVPGKGS